MSLDLSTTVIPGQRLRLTYRISASYLSGGMSAALQAARMITDAWNNNDVAAYSISDASSPVQGGDAPLDAGFFGLLSDLAGRLDYFSAIDIRIDQAAASVTYDELLQPMKRVALGLLGFDARADLDHADLISVAGGAAALAAPARTNATTAAATASQANAGGPKALGALMTLLEIAVAVAALAAVIYVFGFFKRGKS